MAQAKRVGNVYQELKRMYKPKYIVLNIAAAIVYYFVFTFLIRYQNYGILLVTVPWYLEYAIIITASVLLTISVYSVRNTRKNEAKLSASSVSVVTVLLGGIFGGCGCATPLIFELTALGISSSELFSWNAVLSSNAAAIFGAILALNLIMLAYYLNKFSKLEYLTRKK